VSGKRRTDLLGLPPTLAAPARRTSTSTKRGFLVRGPGGRHGCHGWFHLMPSAWSSWKQRGLTGALGAAGRFWLAGTGWHWLARPGGTGMAPCTPPAALGYLQHRLTAADATRLYLALHDVGSARPQYHQHDTHGASHPSRLKPTPGPSLKYNVCTTKAAHCSNKCFVLPFDHQITISPPSRGSRESPV
jgi:hypothetical protein